MFHNRGIWRIRNAFLLIIICYVPTICSVLPGRTHCDFESDFSFQINAICVIWLQLINGVEHIWAFLSTYIHHLQLNWTDCSWYFSPSVNVCHCWFLEVWVWIHQTLSLLLVLDLCFVTSHALACGPNMCCATLWALRNIICEIRTSPLEMHFFPQHVQLSLIHIWRCRRTG